MSDRSRIHHTVVATLDAVMLLVAWDQQESMSVATNIHSRAGNLATIVDVLDELQVQSGIGWNQSIQVEHRAILPQKGTQAVKVATGNRAAPDLFCRVNRGRKGVTIAV
jgi:hypothetical protein